MNLKDIEGKSFQQLAAEYPKVAMLIEYLVKHYPNDKMKLSNNPLIATAIMSPEYSNSQVEDIVDKVAILNGCKKWTPQS